MSQLSGKTAVITGSTSGIGLAIADAYAKAGADIVLNGLGSEADNADAIQQVAAHGTRVTFSPANMMQPGQIAEMLETAERDLDGVDILINNAGIQYVAPIDEFPVEKWDAIIAINLTAAFHCCRHAVPLMKSRKWGRIISTASAHATIASPYKSAYIAAKHGILGLMKTVALETAEHGVTANCISPGYVWTPLVEGQIADTAKARGISEAEVKSDVMLGHQPTKEFVTVDEIAATALFLASDGAASITGTNIAIDGGYTAQ